MKSIAVQGLTLAHALGSLVSGGVFVVTSLPSTKIKAGQRPIYERRVSFTFTGGSAGGFQGGTLTGFGTIQTTATKMQKAVLEGDGIQVAFSGTKNNGNPGGVSGRVEISNAGQSVARAQ